MKSKLKIKILVDEDNNKTGILMSIKSFKKLLNDLEDLRDLEVAYRRMSDGKKTIPYEKVMSELLGNDTKK